MYIILWRMSCEILSRLFKVGKFSRAGKYLIAEIENFRSTKIIKDKNNIIAVGHYQGKLMITYKNNELQNFLFYMGINDNDLLEFVIAAQNKEL